MTLLVSRLRASFLRILRGSDFVRNVAVLAGGTAVSQGLAVLASPLLTRLYTPENFGVLAVYVSILTLLTVVASLRYELAIPLPGDDETAANLLALALSIVLGMTVLSGVAFWFLGDQVVSWANVPALRAYLWLLPLTLLMCGAYQSLSYWTTRKKRFSLISHAKGIQALGLVGTQVVGGLLGLGPIGLIAGNVLGRFLGVVSLLHGTRLPPGAIVPARWKALGKAYKDFPLFSVWGALINVIGQQVPHLLLVKYFTLDTGGFFSLTMRILGLPTALVGQAVAQVFYPTAAESSGDSQTARRLVEQVATSLFMLSFVIFAFVGLHGPFLFSLVFGTHWNDAGRYAQYLAPWFVLSFVSSPLSTFVLVKGKQKEAFWITLYEAGLRLGAVWLGAKCTSPDLAVGLFAAAGTLISLVYIAWVLHLAGSGLIAWLRSIKAFVLLGALVLVGLFASKFFLSPVISLILSGGGLGLFGLWFYEKLQRGY